MLLLAWLCYDFFTLISEGFFSKKGKLLAYTLHILITQCMSMAWNAVYSAAAATLDIYVMNLVGTACSIWSQRPSLPTQNGPCLHTLHLFFCTHYTLGQLKLLGRFWSQTTPSLAYTLHILITQCMCMAWNAVYLTPKSPINFGGPTTYIRSG